MVEGRFAAVIAWEQSTEIFIDKARANKENQVVLSLDWGDESLQIEIF